MNNIPSWIPPGNVWIEVINLESALTALELLLCHIFSSADAEYPRETDTVSNI